MRYGIPSSLKHPSPIYRGTFWECDYFVSTVGLDEAMVIEYIRTQEQADEQRDQLKFGM